jgi:hypothetical protein
MSNERNEEDISTVDACRQQKKTGKGKFTHNTQYEYLSHGQSQEQEGPLSRRYLVRVLVFVFVRLVRHAGSATSVARNAHFLGTIIN